MIWIQDVASAASGCSCSSCDQTGNPLRRIDIVRVENEEVLTPCEFEASVECRVGAPVLLIEDSNPVILGKGAGARPWLIVCRAVVHDHDFDAVRSVARALAIASPIKRSWLYEGTSTLTVGAFMVQER